MNPRISRFRWAVVRMRYFQEKEEVARLSVSDRRDALKESYKENFTRTKRETFNALDSTVTQLANSDAIGKTLIGDENYYRNLVSMYAQIALVERAIEEKEDRESSHRVCHAHPSRPGRTMDGR